MKTDYLIIADGGSKGNGAQNAAYGSYKLATSDGRERIVRLHDLGKHTNNEAEYMTIIHALKDLIDRIIQTGAAPTTYTIEIRTDSQLIVGQVTGTFKCKAANLRPLLDDLVDLAAAFKSRTIRKVPRADMVEILGH